MEKTASKTKAPAKPRKTTTIDQNAGTSQTMSQKAVPRKNVAPGKTATASKAVPANKAAATHAAVAPGNTVVRGKAPTTRKATTKANGVLEMSVSAPDLQAQIAELAHRFWTERGRQHGHHEEDWYRAERELFAKAS